MITQQPSQEIINACRLLFPAAVAVDACFLDNMANEDVRAAFRKRALKTHPDRSLALGRSYDELNRLFQDVSLAYETLKGYLSEKETQPAPSGQSPGAARPAASRSSRRAADHDYYYRGGGPRRELRLGEFLYYSGIISWRTLIGAIVWQKRQRPLFGEIARQWNFLSENEIRQILSNKSWNEMFGDCARRFGLLSSYQQMAVTGRQRQLQPLFGTHFVANRVLSASQVEMLARRKQQHNFRLRYS